MYISYVRIPYVSTTIDNINIPTNHRGALI